MADFDADAFYVSFSRDAQGTGICSIVLPRDLAEVRFRLDDLPAMETSLAPEVFEVARRAAPALPDGRRVGIRTKQRPAPAGILADGPGDLVLEKWDPEEDRYIESSSFPFDDLMLCVERGEHNWRFHQLLGQDRCTRCQVMKDGSYPTA